MATKPKHGTITVANKAPSVGTANKGVTATALGFKGKTAAAVNLYLQQGGATTAAICAVNGGPYRNCLNQITAAGHNVVKVPVANPSGSGRAVYSYCIVVKRSALPKASKGA